ncbi:IS110 family RNA-guided transposase [Paracraurococcus lichenis]|uniref:IS110 family transposase n=1 Tax=Paracraurococcus lichenis TaxID=3064888 RepID=A0ABT9E925_9PROT|nr:IS110 family transposase [Paracraurococcus sp. LOR1-02]MDO9712683.1 IS110 family transposase [Paracraurococcus sp. LOR1-02]
MEKTTPATEIVVGIDTHKRTHTAVALNSLGARLGSTTVPVSREGYRQLEAWARTFGAVRAFGIEGTGCYGAGLSRVLRDAGYRVLEVNRPDRSARRRHGKDDPLDAEAAARAVLSGQATAEPKAGTGSVEMIRHLTVARDAAVKAKTQAMLTLKSIIVSAPAELREQLESISGEMTLARQLAALRPGRITSPTASAKAALKAIARRWLALKAEIGNHDRELDVLVAASAPDLIAAPGIATVTAAEMLLLVGDNPERIRSEGALAKLCGVCPIPASSGQTNRHRLNRGGNRQANAALHRVVVTRMRRHQPTIDYVARRTKEGMAMKEIMRCLKRYVAREIFGLLCRPRQTAPTAA